MDFSQLLDDYKSDKLKSKGKRFWKDMKWNHDKQKLKGDQKTKIEKAYQTSDSILKVSTSYAATHKWFLKYNLLKSS